MIAWTLGFNLNSNQSIKTLEETVTKDWRDYPLIVAHAGGAVRHSEQNYIYTNSLEALEQNYQLGQRLFEFDFTLTTDHQLAVLHDWSQSDNHSSASPMSLKEWKTSQIHAIPDADATFTPLTIDDILDQMIIRPDMYLITDTKSFSLTEDETKLQFYLIYTAASRRNPELLKRIIPQIYNHWMYEQIMSIYPWNNIIYTTYACPHSHEEVIAFADAHDNIKAITFPAYQPFTSAEITNSHQKGLLLFSHTINDSQELSTQLAMGIDGVYTDLLLPHDLLEIQTTFHNTQANNNETIPVNDTVGSK